MAKVCKQCDGLKRVHLGDVSGRKVGDYIPCPECCPTEREKLDVLARIAKALEEISSEGVNIFPQAT